MSDQPISPLAIGQPFGAQALSVSGSGQARRGASPPHLLETAPGAKPARAQGAGLSLVAMTGALATAAGQARQLAAIPPLRRCKRAGPGQVGGERDGHGIILKPRASGSR